MSIYCPSSGEKFVTQRTSEARFEYGITSRQMRFNLAHGFTAGFAICRITAVMRISDYVAARSHHDTGIATLLLKKYNKKL